MSLTAAALLALVVALLAVPVVFTVDADYGNAWHVRWHVRGLFGLVDVRRTSPGPPHAPTQTQREPHAQPQRWRRRGVMRPSTALVRRTGHLVVALWRRVQVERFHLHAQFGFEDPVETGIAYGWLAPVATYANARGFDVRCTPRFLDHGLTAGLGATIRLRPLWVVGTLLAFALSPPVVRAISASWLARA